MECLVCKKKMRNNMLGSCEECDTLADILFQKFYEAQEAAINYKQAWNSHEKRIMK